MLTGSSCARVMFEIACRDLVVPDLYLKLCMGSSCAKLGVSCEQLVLLVCCKHVVV